MKDGDSEKVVKCKNRDHDTNRNKTDPFNDKPNYK